VVQVAECNIHNHKLEAVQDVVDVLPKNFTENEAVRVKFAVMVVNAHVVALVDVDEVHALAAQGNVSAALKNVMGADANVN
jgi:hypothetical protein